MAVFLAAFVVSRFVTSRVEHWLDEGLAGNCQPINPERQMTSNFFVSYFCFCDRLQCDNIYIYIVWHTYAQHGI